MRIESRKVNHTYACDLMNENLLDTYFCGLEGSYFYHLIAWKRSDYTCLHLFIAALKP